MYICMYAYLYILTYMCEYIYTSDIYICACEYLCMYKPTHTHHNIPQVHNPQGLDTHHYGVRTYLQPHTPTHPHTHTYLYTYLCARVSVCVYI